MSKIKVSEIQGRGASHEAIELDNTYSIVRLKGGGVTSLLTTTTGVALAGGLDLYVQDLANAPTITLSIGNGNIQTLTLGQDTTVNFSNDFIVGCFILLFVNRGNNEITWPTSGILWSGGSEPTLSTTYTHCLKIYKINSTQIAIFDEGVVY